MRRSLRLLSLPLLLLAILATACGGDERSESAGEVHEHAATALEVAQGSADTVVRAAAAALRARRAWDATRLLAPLVQGDRATAVAAPVAILAAQAAAGWGGWTEAARILGASNWRSSAHAGEGHELLARLAFERNDGAAAAIHADSAVRAPGASSVHGVRLTLLARALDRASQHDTAAATYARAAALLPHAADWLRLRAAGVTRDAGARRRLYRDVETEAARARIPWTEVLALELSGAAREAAALYDSLEARPQALRLRLALDSSDAAAQATLRRTAFALAAAPRNGAEWRRTMAIVDSTFPTRTAAEELAIARSAARHGTAARAISAFESARAAGATLTAQDQYDYAMAFTRAGRWRDAASRLAAVPAESRLGGRAAYQRARALLRAGDAGAARTALRRVVSAHAGDASGASSALYLLADLATDDGRDAAARSAWRELVTKYPRSTLAPTSAFKAALVAYIAGNFAVAASEWDAAAAAYPRSDEAAAMRYWAGRAHARKGDAAAARARWQGVVDGTTTSYYAILAARRLGVKPWVPAASGDSPPAVPMVDSAMARIALLDSLGMTVESGHERTALLERIEGNVDAMLAAGAAFRDAGESSRAIALGLKVADTGRRDAMTYRLIYPLLHREALVAAASRAKLEPALVAALVRQESSFNPRAVSPVGARGLMQLMPSVGRSIARTRGYPLWDEALLLEPTVSFDLGTAHLAGDLSRQRDLTRALAAYNAGAARVRRWSTKPGVADPEVFAERIPYVETRDYVRIVQRNVVMYGALYGF